MLRPGPAFRCLRSCQSKKGFLIWIVSLTGASHPQPYISWPVLESHSEMLLLQLHPLSKNVFMCASRSQTEARNISRPGRANAAPSVHECVSMSFHRFACLEKSEGEGMSQVIYGGQQNSSVVSVQVHAGDEMQL